MISKIINLFKKQELVRDFEGESYVKLFEKAKIFTAENEFTLDSNSIGGREESVAELINEISNILVNEIPVYLEHGFNPIVMFGGDCGNIHYAIINFIKSYYPAIAANITIGEFSISNQSYFEFNQDKCLEWLKNGSPRVFDCHTWITINDDFILDCTIGTYINTRIDPYSETNKSENLFGGLIFGNVDNLQHIAFRGLSNKTPQNYLKMKYSPVILGLEAFSTLAPKQP